ncbi:MAG: tRNA lysidine(34) synthetase TilS [Sulfurimicrobium sp.]|nr:tRNA lysidine(34) synthetase TilS [Sulfurimicrobium sp.]MDP1704531.1 tRNA lysidine(34) synthetase TilS [Sulfurimicrobium sp.]MDP2198439.1 tRNA lysidine(34) synthetase TilS [Sulfurimicrobium sp.]MDP3689237.1 tRNA lysidine(34) synthetase TilS [Sulfurimicrobium sp.]
MASSKKLPENLVTQVALVLSQRVRPGQHLALGLSGGLDSVVLLDLLAQLRPTLQFRLSAIHINHQLSPHAGDWADFCSTLCQSFAVPLDITVVQVPFQPGDSLEAVARTVRHEALARHSADHIVLAHHLDDQAETLLLQLLRGCGVDGASAMAEQGGRLLRPLLKASRAQLEQHARQRGLNWVEDESNLDTRFDRNFMRHSLLPVLAERFPAYRETLLRASRNFSESAQLQEELARHDAAGAIQDRKLSVQALARLSLPRAKNLLRHFLKLHGIAAPSSTRLEDMLHQLLSARQDAQIRIPLGPVELRRFLGQAWVIHPTLNLPDRSLRRAWQGEKELTLNELGGTLILWPVHGQGISRARLEQAPVTLRLRHGGERLQPDCLRPRRSLKNLFQETGIPPWMRQTLPLLFSGEHMAAGLGIGIDCAYQAHPDEPGIMLEWKSNGSLD